MGVVQYRSDIQGLRAIAVLAVILFHFNPAWLPGGFVGVDVFLAISGFLIFNILLHKKTQPSYTLKGTLKYFYSSRFKRIAPAYFTMLILVSFASAVLFLPHDLASYLQGLKKALWFNSNNYFAGFGDYFALANHEQPLLHTWSLAVEIQFYLLIPFIILLVPSKALKWTIGTVFVLLLALAEYQLNIDGTEQATYYSLYARLPEFLAGGLVALFRAHKPQASNAGGSLAGFGLILILAAALLQPKLGHFPGLHVLLPVTGAVFVLLHPARGNTQLILSSRPMVWLGELSYSLYLWHWPVLALLRYYTGEQVLDMFFSLLFVILTLTLAVVLFYSIENTLRKHRAGIKYTLSYALLAIAVFGTTKSIAKLNEALSPQPLPIEYHRYEDPAKICHGQIVGDCLKGDLNSTKEVLVLGDSHAAMLNILFDKIGKEQGFKARVITASSCVTIPGFDYQRIAEWAQKACQSQIENARVYISQAQTIFVAGMWSYHMQSEKFQRTLNEFLEKSGPRRRIYVISQIPLLNKSPMRSLRFNSIGLNSVPGRDERYFLNNSSLEGICAKYPNVMFLKLDELKLFSAVPIYEGEILYYDESHMNEIGMIEYSKQANKIFKTLMKHDKLLGVDE